MSKPKIEAADLELVEYPDGAKSVTVPNVLVINGTPVLCAEPPKVEQHDSGHLTVTAVLHVKSLTVRQETTP